MHTARRIVLADQPIQTQTPSPAQVESGGPEISVALLVKNGMPNLKELLSRLAAQRGCPSVEIVALDSGSTDGSLEALHEAGAKVERIAPATFRFGPCRQKVFELTSGRVIVTMSQDTLPTSDGWLAAMTRPILDGETEIVGATEIPPKEEEIKLAILNCASPHDHWKAPFYSITCVGLAISREAWRQTGFGDVPMSEDKFLGMQARAKGFRMKLCAEVPLLHGHGYSLMGHIKRSFNEGLGARYTDGLYSFGMMLRDIFASSRYRMAASAVFKHRALSVYEACWFPLRPVFIYLGWRFGKRYWR
jgi:rhamnosyltransferase